MRKHARHLAAAMALSVTWVLCACSSQGSSSGLTAASSCKTYLTASKGVQDDAVKIIAVAQNDSSVLTPLGRPKVDYFCGNDDGLTLGGAIAHAGQKPTAASSSATAPPGRPRSRATTAMPAPAVRVTVTAGAPQLPSGPGALKAAFYAAVPVDPNPYMGAHPNVYFTSPSQNIGCYVLIDLGNRVECTIAAYSFSQPGPDCPGGAVVSINAGGEPSIPTCASTSLSPDPYDTLLYGQSITNGNLGCVSTRDGVSCLDLTTGAGFTLSRAQYITVP